ncbi:CpsD/CapB family tyrosine-protein kinase [Domibacillus sp. A3M-37]|uniref:CpsD/CapB family tyrosine-protein kinase n=1 Tax=Domibacillus sp. A3M-37 TaxID=2962037 RepID=UPI0020B8CB24|nr:CpsD/CapB family tyrosine-protein kinase [Domibacillus sp. A3M-37]MCP3761372.1 CpsD/CapB family tyrosine-protein kinase [Domibacillus sp. A3M-37]
MGTSLSCSFIAEQYRTIRTNILFSSVNESYRMLLVTSTEQAEGKSTTVANLAVVLSDQRKKVLLVDADTRKPTLHHVFSLPNRIGLTNVLVKQISCQEAFSKTKIDNLFVLTSGPIPPNPAELLGSSVMKEFSEKVLSEFDYVLVDTPPILLVTDAQVLANQCDRTIFVVNSGKANVDKTRKAKELLQSAKAKLLGVVLNNREIKDFNSYYIS